MDDLIQRVSERAGIDPEQARKAVETVMAYLKEHGPDMLGKIQGMFARGEGGGEGSGGIGDVMGKIGGLFGKKE